MRQEETVWLMFSCPCEVSSNIYIFFPPHLQPLSSSEFWQMVKQHYGYDLGLSHEEMESLQIAAESNMQTR